MRVNHLTNTNWHMRDEINWDHLKNLNHSLKYLCNKKKEVDWDFIKELTSTYTLRHEELNWTQLALMDGSGNLDFTTSAILTTFTTLTMVFAYFVPAL